MKSLHFYNGPDCLDSIWHECEHGYCVKCGLSNLDKVYRVRGQKVLAGTGGRSTNLAVRLAKEQDNKCCWCKREFSMKLWPTLEHLIPRSKGGLGTRKNLRASCHFCNNERGDLPVKIWVAYMKTHSPWRDGNWDSHKRAWYNNDNNSNGREAKRLAAMLEA